MSDGWKVKKNYMKNQHLKRKANFMYLLATLLLFFSLSFTKYKIMFISLVNIFYLNILMYTNLDSTLKLKIYYIKKLTTLLVHTTFKTS